MDVANIYADAFFSMSKPGINKRPIAGDSSLATVASSTTAENLCCTVMPDGTCCDKPYKFTSVDNHRNCARTYKMCDQTFQKLNLDRAKNCLIQIIEKVVAICQKITHEQR